MGGIQSANVDRENDDADEESSTNATVDGGREVPAAGAEVPLGVGKTFSSVANGCETTLPDEGTDSATDAAPPSTPYVVVVESNKANGDDGIVAESDDDDEDMLAKCRARKMTTELAAFRANLQQKRGVHLSKLVQVREELEQLRAALAEEKSRNRALIKYIQQQQEQENPQEKAHPPEASAPPTVPDDSCSSLNLACQAGRRSLEAHEMRERERSPRVEQSTIAAAVGDDRSDHTTTVTTTTTTSTSDAATNTTATGDERRALKKELAESQLELQQVTGETLALRQELAQLRTQLHSLQDEALAESSRQNGAIRALKAQLAEAQFHLQIAQAEALSLQTDVGQLRTQVQTLKDVIKAGKEIIAIREDQVEQLKGKLRQIEDTLQERELQIMSDDLRREYDRQLTNIRNLRDLYEERERVSRMERDNLLRQLDLKKNELATEQERNKNLEALVESLQSDLTCLRAEREQTDEKLSHSQAQTKQLQLEMGVVNQFISKFLLGMSRKPTVNEINIDKLAAVLEENRALLIEMTKDEAETVDTGAFLPRALYDLIAEVDEANGPPVESEMPDAPPKEDAPVEADSEGSGGEDAEFTDVQKASPEQIADKLPKVWRVLIELVNHQERAQPVPFVEGGESEECLQSVQTRNGPKTVVSVSKTYIKLKDLILEKKALKRETNRLKTLNVHLERRLETQEKRLSVVSLELTKTWHLVGKMQRQHRQLHTQEQILRYHLQQKRRLLCELKEELEYCRLKWSAARQKNIESEDQWRSLKADFAARRKQDSLNNSAGESGYSDEQPSDDDDDGRAGRKAAFSTGGLPVAGCSGLSSLVPAGASAISVMRFERQFLSSSLTNIYQAISTLRKVHSESDMKSLENVERANRFCNEKIEELPPFPDDDDDDDDDDVHAETSGLPDAAVLRKANPVPTSSNTPPPTTTATTARTTGKRGRKKRKNTSGPETAQDMFLRLMNLGHPELPDEQAQDQEQEDDETEEGTGNDNAEGEYSVNESASELSEEELEGAEVARAPEPEELSSEELFQQKREARLQRMAELNSRLDQYSAPTTSDPKVAGGERSEQTTTDQQLRTAPDGQEAALSEDEEKYLQRRAARLERLEREAQEFRNRLSKTVNRGTEIAAQIDEIHSGFMARQAESGSPVPGSSGLSSTASGSGLSQARKHPLLEPLPTVDLSCLTDKEREYTSARSERLARLEDDSQSLLRQMNQTMRRGSSLTTKLDMLHSRYAAPAEAPAADSNPSSDCAPDKTNNDSESQESVECCPALDLTSVTSEDGGTVDEALLPGPYSPMGPLELVLVSDDDDEGPEMVAGPGSSSQPEGDTQPQ
ncbi:uncharacterized protein LOC128275593 [Anopheles cruzii]|uniref:uncharacterized protein LOC128275593 n=1 Tax=Anopheles cruzii TaxID=68878 RepID=UPI0022EC965F|nr:uncharacterized protein LOC128275593 [Anopheles cruzii]